MYHCGLVDKSTNSAAVSAAARWWLSIEFVVKILGPSAMVLIVCLDDSAS